MSASVSISAEEAMALPMPLHRLRRDEEGRASVICDAPPLAACRLTCVDRGCLAEAWPCGADEDDGDNATAHRMTDSGECVVLLYLNTDDPDECAEDDDERGAYVGRVSVLWDGDTYVWTGCDPPDPSASGATS